MKRITANIFLTIQLLLAATLLALYCRSFWYVDEFGLGATKDARHLRISMRTLYSEHGAWLFMVENLRFFDGSHAPISIRSYFDHDFWEIHWSINAGESYTPPQPPAAQKEIWTFLGLGVKHTPATPSFAGTAEKSATYVVIPMWMPLLLTLVMPTWRSWILLRHSQRMRAGQCPNCSYDLRAHHPDQKCPECGTPIPRFGWRKKSVARVQDRTNSQ